MKKYLLLLLSVLFTISVKADEGGKNITMTKGQTITIDLANDLGIPNKWYNCVYDLTYTVSDPSALSIVPYEHNSATNFSAKYTTYDITAQKTGTYTFKIKYDHYVSGGSGGSSNNHYTYNITVVDVIAISMVQTLSMFVGDEETLNPIIVQTDAETTLTWLSSNPSVATVNEEGKITGISSGKTTITCIAHNGVSAQCEVTVNPVLVSGITLNQTESEMTVGESLQLQPTISPDNATDKTVTWSSTNESVAVVSESGLVTAVGSGTCQVKATANDGSGKTGSCLVTVEKNNKLTVTDMTQCSGGRGVLNVLLTDEETIIGFQFDLQLPAGVTVAESGDALLATLTGNAVNTHTISSSKVSDGLYRFIVTPKSTRAISNANGDGMTITIDVADNVAVGTYDMTIKDIEMTVRRNGNVYEAIHPKDCTALLTIIEAMMGDVNGDGFITVTDVISLNSYILEEEPARFIRKVADMNGDGHITMNDLARIIDIILGR